MRPLGLMVLALSLLSTSGQSGRPILLFAGDDPLGMGYYDASVLVGKRLRGGATSGEKLPVEQGSDHREYGRVHWSIGMSSWVVSIFSPGFGTHDLRAYEELQLTLNAPKPLAHPPLVRLKSLDGRQSAPVPLAGSIDADPSTTQSFILPLSRFSGINLDQFQSLIFESDRVSSGELWITEIRFVDHQFQPPENPPSIPSGLIGHAGDRTLSFSWNWPQDRSSLLGYNIYRQSADGRMQRLNPRLISIQGFADTAVENGQTYHYEVRAVNEAGEGPSARIQLTPRLFEDDEAFLDYLQAAAFNYFWFESNPANGLTRDRSQPFAPASIAATGFALTALGVGIDHGWISRSMGFDRALTTLRFFANAPQHDRPTGAAGNRGWFYHFLDMETGARFNRSELSSIDTGLLLLGILYAREYFNQSQEQELRTLADQITSKIDWRWMLNGPRETLLGMGWHPESGFIGARWRGYNEASFLYLLGLGAAPANRLDSQSWLAWTASYSFTNNFVPFAPLFGHQYTACWIDLRYTADKFMRDHKLTYFENSRRATLAQRRYAIENPLRYPGYGENIWGWTACDGPGAKGTHGYIARGVPPVEFDDGTIAPTAPGGSLPFAPTETVAALREMYDRYRSKIWHPYGLRDAFHIGLDWWSPDVIGIDQGPILLMAENLRTRRVWSVLKASAMLKTGLERAGFEPLQR